MEVVVCKVCNDHVEHIEEGAYYCHSCGKGLDDTGVEKEDLFADGYIKRDGNTIEAKGIWNVIEVMKGF